MSYEVKGILHVKGAIQKRSEKFSTRQFTVKTMDDKYEQFITFELLNDRTDLIDAFGVEPIQILMRNNHLQHLFGFG